MTWDARPAEPSSRHALRAAAWLAILAVAARMLMAWTYAPVAYGDTPSYVRMAGIVAEGIWAKLDGTRTPGYPVFLALAGPQPERVMLAQMALGVGISLLLYWMVWQTTHSVRLALLAGACYTAVPAQILFEANLLTETLTTFWIVLSFALFSALTRSGAHAGRQAALAAALGVTSSLAGLTRPLFYVLPVCFLPWVAAMPRAGWTPRLARTAFFLLGPIVLLGGWMTFIHRHYSVWSPTVMGGFSLVQHTGAWFEFLPDEQAALRDTYLRFRGERLAERGNQTNTIWDAIPELSRASGLGFYDLSRELQRLSLQLIRDHPLLYARSALDGWVAFWKAPVYWDPALVSLPWLAGVGQAAAMIGRVVCLAANAAFLLASLLAVASRSVRLRLRREALLLASAGAIWVTSIVQTLVDHGDNPRFLIPLQSMVCLAVILAAWRWTSGNGKGQEEHE